MLAERTPPDDRVHRQQKRLAKERRLIVDQLVSYQPPGFKPNLPQPLDPMHVGPSFGLQPLSFDEVRGRHGATFARPLSLSLP
jgi:hypothetical protein